MKRLSTVVVPLTLTLTLAACSDDTPASDNADETSSSTGSGESGDGDGDGDPGVADFGPVRGDLEIASIEVSQSLVQTLFEAGTTTAPQDYGVPLIKNRHTIFRALWTTPEGWTPRPLIAKLHIELPDGTTAEFVDFQTSLGTPTIVDSSSTASDLFSSFFWRLDPEYVVPGMRYQISIWEAEPADALPESSVANTYPPAGPTAIEIQPEDSQIRIALVGVRYDTDECVSDTSVLPEDEFEALRAGFEAWNAVATDAVIIDTGLSVDIDYPLNGVQSLLGVVGQIRAQFADEIPDAFFYIIWDDCSPVPQGVLGIAPVNSDPPQLDDAASRYAAGLWNHNDVRESINTAVHEIGHNQGAPHAPCGVGNNSDPEFPHAGASIGLRGLDPQNGDMYSPNNYTDFMSYCRPYWVSDYRWTKSFNHQKTITAWGTGDMAPSTAPALPGYRGAVLVGLILPDGETQWWINSRTTPPAVTTSGELRVELELGAATLPVASRVKDLPDLPGAKLVEVPLVGDIDDATITGIRVRGRGLDVVSAGPTIVDHRGLKIHGTPFATVTHR